MRRRILAVMLALATSLAGCASVPAADETDAAPPSADETPPLPAAGLVAERPAHPVGRAWTFEGDELYNADPSFTIVVAEATQTGYTFAAGAEDDLVYPALWGSPWFGRRTADLGQDGGASLLEFPLVDGRSWQHTASITVTARETIVETPQGAERGFRIEGANDRWRMSYDYALSLGQVVRWHTQLADGSIFEDIRMVDVRDGEAWIWFELGDLMVVPGPQAPQAFEVPSGFDAVLVSAGGRDGSRTDVVAPDGAGWSETFAGHETWRHGILPATPGRWEAAVTGWPYVEDAPDLPVEGPIGWGYAHVAPVRWIRGP